MINVARSILFLYSTHHFNADQMQMKTKDWMTVQLHIKPTEFLHILSNLCQIFNSKVVWRTAFLIAMYQFQL